MATNAEADCSQDAFDAVPTSLAMTKEGDQGAAGESNWPGSDPRHLRRRHDWDEEREGGGGQSVAADDDDGSRDVADKCPEVTKQADYFKCVYVPRPDESFVSSVHV